MANPILQTRRFAENKGCVLPSVKHQTCRERAVALLAQQKEHDCTCNVQLKHKVKDLEERVSRIQEENMQLISELEKCEEYLQWKEREMQRQGLELQKERSEYEKRHENAEERIQHLQESLKNLEGSYMNMVLQMAVDRELQLEECQRESASKDKEICTLQLQLQEQRREYHQDRRDAEEKIRRLQEAMKSLEESHINMVTVAMDRELQLHDSERESASKDREICTHQFELSKLQEQRSATDKDFKKAEERVRKLVEGLSSDIREYRAVKDLKTSRERGGSRHFQKEEQRPPDRQTTDTTSAEQPFSGLIS